MITNAKDLQKSIMLNSKKYWNKNDLYPVLCENCRRRKIQTIDFDTMARYIREFRESEHAIIVLKKQVATRTYVYKLMTRGGV